MAKGRLDTAGRVMSKVARGKKLTKEERLVLAGLIDGAKKSKSEKREERSKRKRKRKKSKSRKKKRCCK